MTLTRTALVTGGCSGIGKATVERLRSRGIHVIVLDRSGSADVVVDVTDAPSLIGLENQLPSVDILVNSAGVVGESALFLNSEERHWRTPMEVNLFGAVNAMRAFVPGMVKRGWGRVVNVASIAGKEGTLGLAGYAASKGALIAATKSIGKELAETGVLVNVVAPGTIRTPMTEATDPAIIAHTTGLIPMRRMGEAGEVAALVSWLASDEMSFSAGAVFDVSGGRATY